MATAIGTNVVTSLARHFILPEITDNIYASQVVTFRLMAANKRIIRGGTQLEFPLMFTRMAAGGFYSGMDPLDVSPTLRPRAVITSSTPLSVGPTRSSERGRTGIGRYRVARPRGPRIG